MPDVNELVETIKRAAIDAVEATKPVRIYFGEVMDTDPLKINVEQKMILGENQLILTRAVFDEGLAAGSRVILIRIQGGQKFIVMDNLV
nr:MAG TPA: Protein of unknown function (DUF2577) [Caudoviricetes sp.]